MAALEYEILTTHEEIEALADDWRELYARTGRSPYADYDWFASWWESIGKSRESLSVHVVAAREAGRLAGVLPLSILRRKGVRVLQAAGSQAYACDMLSETAESAVELWDAARRGLPYDFATIRDVYPETFCYQALLALGHRRDEAEAFLLRFDWPTGKDWLASLPGKVRRNFDRRLRRLEEKGPVQYEVYESGPLPAAVIDGIVEQKKKWCATHDIRGLFDHPEASGFFHRLLEGAAKQNSLFLSWLRCGDDIISANLCFLHGDVVYGYVIVYDPAWGPYAPGSLIIRNSICWAIDNGYRAFDLRQGGREFKSIYSNEARPCAEFTFSASAAGRVAESGFIAARAVKRAIDRRRKRKADAAKGASK